MVQSDKKESYRDSTAWNLATTAAAGVAGLYATQFASELGSTIRHRIINSARSAGRSIGNYRLTTPPVTRWGDTPQYQQLQRVVRTSVPPRARSVPRMPFRRRRYRRRPVRRRVYRRRRARRFRPRRRFARRRYVRRRPRRFRRSRARTFAARTGYRRRHRSIRPNARGSIRSLYGKMITGQQLPWIAFGKARFNQVFQDDLYQYPDTTRIWTLNSLTPFSGANATTINYNGLYNILYEQYIVLGAKFQVKIIPCQLIRPGVTNINVQDSSMPTSDFSNGYYYIRYYYPGRVTGDTDNAIGVPITNNEETDVALNARWDREIDFLQDRSVVYSRDGRSWYNAFHENVNESNNFLQITRELGTWNRDRGVNLTFKFSAKRMYRFPGILQGASGQASTDDNPFWADFGSSPSIPLQIRLGYISFTYDENGQPLHSFWPPMRQEYKFYTCTDYYCAFRRPTDTSTLRSTASINNMMASRITSVSEDPQKRVHFEDDDPAPVSEVL